MQFLRLLLLPFSLLYGCITAVRNWLFDRGISKTYVIPNRSICIGNITVGGTGKSPMTIYLAELLKDVHPVILSRGYGRSTKGPRLAGPSDNASTIGDEPFMYSRRFGDRVPVVVAEERRLGIELIHRQFDDATILLDDAFQHRQVRAGFQLVLMTWDRPIFRDFPFPAGNLRENRSGLRRADAVVITKTPTLADETAKQHFLRQLGFPAERVFFSSIDYGALVPLFDATWQEPEKVLLVTGIANPDPLKAYLEQRYAVELMAFPDHHAFSLKDIQAIHQKVATFASHRYAIVTTEKDAVRLLGLEDNSLIRNAPWFYQRMQIRIERENDFNDLLLKYVTGANERSR
jgi:tetraacyldisaccharide 4'-kinase